MTRDEVTADLMEISGIGEAKAEAILAVLDDHHPNNSFDGFESVGETHDTAAVLNELSRARALLNDRGKTQGLRISHASERIGDAMNELSVEPEEVPEV